LGGNFRKWVPPVKDQKEKSRRPITAKGGRSNVLRGGKKGQTAMGKRN